MNLSIFNKKILLDFQKLQFNTKLLVLFPIILVTGPFLSDLVITVNSFFFLYLIYKNKINILSDKFVKFFLIFYIYLIFISFFSADNLISFKSSITYLRFLLFVSSSIYFFRKYDNSLYLFFLTGFTCLMFVSIDAIIQFIFGFNILGLSKVHPYRVSGLFGDELILGSYLSRLFPIFLGLYIYFFSKKNKSNLYILFFILIIGSAILISGERTSLGLFILTMFLCLMTLKEFRLLIIKSLSIILLISIILISTSENLKKRVVNETINQIFVIQKSDGINKSLTHTIKKINIFSEGHQKHILTAYNIFKANIIIGSGPKTFRILCDNQKFNVGVGSCTTHPHNIYIQLLSETGFVGFLFVFSIFIYFAFKLCQNLFLTRINKKDEDYYICFLIAGFINLWPFFPTGNFFNNYFSMFYFLPFIFILLKKKN